MNLEEAIESAAEHLPEGWEIVIHVERGSAWVALVNEEGDEILDEDSDCETKLWEVVTHYVGLATQQPPDQEAPNAAD